MFSKRKNIKITSPIKSNDSYEKSLEFFKAGNLSSLHKQALHIHPEWINGFNAGFKKSLGNDSHIFGDIGLAATSNAKLGVEYFLNDQTDFSQKASNIRFSVNPFAKISEFYICVNPSSAFRLKLKNHIFASALFDENYDRQKQGILSSLWTKSGLSIDWTGGYSRVSFSAFTSNSKSITTSLTALTRIASNFLVGAELNSNQDIKRRSITLEPCLATAYWNENMKMVGSMWLKTLKIDLSWFRKINDNIQISSILIIDAQTRNTIATLFGQYSLGDSIIRAKIATNGLIGATYEQKFWHFSILNSVVANVSTKKFVYGMKIGIEV